MAQDETIRTLVERLATIRLPDGVGQSGAQVAEGAIEIALARIQAVTELLQEDGLTDGVSRLAARLLLDELAGVAAHFRARATELAAALDAAAVPLPAPPPTDPGNRR